jgi:hypothetical protein
LVITGGTKEAISVRVLDGSGKVMEVRNNVSNSGIQLGDNYRPGIYIAEVIQGNVKKQFRLIKL